MNTLIIAGNLGKDAELKVFGEDNQVCNFSVATTEKWVNKAGEKQEKTEWFNCELWGKRGAALAAHLTKGSKVIVTGSIETRTYEKDGVKQYRTQVKVKDLEFAGGGNKGGAQQSTGDDAPADDLPVGDSEIPF